MGTDPDTNGQGHVDGFDDRDGFDENEVVTIVDEDGTERHCVVLAITEVGDQQYALLAPAEQLQSDEEGVLELFIFTYEVDESDTEIFGYVEDEETYEAVRSAFSTLISEGDDEDPGAYDA